MWRCVYYMTLRVNTHDNTFLSPDDAKSLARNSLEDHFILFPELRFGSLGKDS